MTGMENAIEQAARALYAHQWSAAVGGCRGGSCQWHGGDSEDEQERHAAHVARALADAGLLAPSPLREEWATRFPDGHLCPGKDRDYDLWFKGDPPKGVNVRRYVTAWTNPGRTHRD